MKLYTGFVIIMMLTGAHEAQAKCYIPPATEEMLVVEHCRVIDPYAQK